MSVIERFPSYGEEEGRIRHNRRKHQSSSGRRRRTYRRRHPLRRRRRGEERGWWIVKTLLQRNACALINTCVGKVRAQRSSSHIPDAFPVAQSLISCIKSRGCGHFEFIRPRISANYLHSFFPLDESVARKISFVRCMRYVMIKEYRPRAASILASVR